MQWVMTISMWKQIRAIYMKQTKIEFNSEFNVQSSFDFVCARKCMEISIVIHVCFPYQFVICFINYLLIWNAVHLLILLMLLLLLLLPLCSARSHHRCPSLAFSYGRPLVYTPFGWFGHWRCDIYIVWNNNQWKQTHAGSFVMLSVRQQVRKKCECVCVAHTQCVWQPFSAGTRIKVTFIAYQQCQCHAAFIPRTNSIIAARTAIAYKHQIVTSWTIRWAFLARRSDDIESVVRFFFRMHTISERTTCTRNCSVFYTVTYNCVDITLNRQRRVDRCIQKENKSRTIRSAIEKPNDNSRRSNGSRSSSQQ